MRVSLAPLFTDLPIVFLALLLVGRLSEFWLHLLMGIGGLFVLWLALDAWRSAGRTTERSVTTSARQDLLHGALINFLNPHPYLFWLTVGAPTVVQAWRLTPWAAVAFVVAFYALLVGSKIVLALAIGRARTLNRQRQWLRLSATLLLLAGIWMLYTAMHGLGWFS
jgi:threonine/homoserine/homoserine lactone efflux protein